MTSWIRNMFVAAAAVAVLGAGIIATQPAYADAVKDRRALMKANSKAAKALGKAAKAGNAMEAKKHAMVLIANADKMVGLFPKGTDNDKLGAKATRAKAAIWMNWDGFKKDADAMKSAAMKVASGDLAAAKAIGKSCGGCHKAFRAPKPKKM